MALQSHWELTLLQTTVFQVSPEGYMTVVLMVNVA